MLDAPNGSTVDTYEGQWDTVSHSKDKSVFTDVNGPKEEVSVGSVDEMSEWESRKLWKVVAKGIREGDFESASKDKSRIENEQRQRRRDEASAGTPWELKHFVRVESDPDCELYFPFSGFELMGFVFRRGGRKVLHWGA